MTAAAASAFTIRELTGDKRVIRLVGRALPYRPYSLDGGQRLDLTWLPGSPEATATVMGPDEKPTTVTGKWKTKFLGGSASGEEPPFQQNGSAVESAQEAADAIDSIRRLGQLLEVSWLDRVRHGFLQKFRQDWDNQHDLGWTMEFAWISQGEFVGPLVTAATLQAADTPALSSQLNKLSGIHLNLSLSFATKFLQTLQNFQHGLEDGITAVEQAVQQLTDQIVSPIRTIKGIIATLSGLDDECQLMFDSVDQELSGAVRGDWSSTKPQGNSETFSEKLATEEYRAALKSFVRETQELMLEMRLQLLSQILTQTVGEHVAADGQDLRYISQLFYGTPFEWRRIMLFNGLLSSQLEIGQRVIVPKINPYQAGQADPGG